MPRKKFTTVTEALGGMSVNEIKMIQMGPGREGKLTLKKEKKQPTGFKLNVPKTPSKVITRRKKK